MLSILHQRRKRLAKKEVEREAEAWISLEALTIKEATAMYSNKLKESLRNNTALIMITILSPRNKQRTLIMKTEWNLLKEFIKILIVTPN